METFAELELENFETEQDGHVGIVRLNKPPANAHDADMVLEFQKMVETIRFDETVRAAVLSSTSDKFFSSGYDIQALQDESPEHIGYASQTSKESILKMRSTDTIFIAAVDGHCMGGGLEFALATDIRYCGDDDGYNLGVPEVKLGLIPGEAGTQLLPRYVGRSKALKMMLNDERLTPSEAADAGIIDELVEPGTCEEEAIEFAKQVASLPNKAVGHIKVAINEGMEMSLYDALAHERELQNQLFDTEGAKEGISAFLEKRDPDFIKAELGDDAVTSDDD
ncbi:enoyl-CoA hydratase/isomerase family protein [Halogeometricum luteum]|uniref:Enoyl-CoA hydratase/isomerase family protein n=1 Tax=Halogeometricum luteum TaxID=2950537 RepID=A0ABU2G417_9EURY|nr:enoyl-CoA hydratase/isomerase family protein [Halogeometricum sp. S3BR5-2]MDS0295530.1 enoyl-CoA hydratase/isomerase family protein [Halogeometricum sp. S3BR5-2]